ncbi:hypothetical protein, partial [Thermogutta sp.]|uniref:hypothetical protein n=1 Tax=Thermogutta sp. TaxID=1962930 RepID=UPI0025F7E3AC
VATLQKVTGNGVRCRELYPWHEEWVRCDNGIAPKNTRCIQRIQLLLTPGFNYTARARKRETYRPGSHNRKNNFRKAVRLAAALSGGQRSAPLSMVCQWTPDDLLIIF